MSPIGRWRAARWLTRRAVAFGLGAGLLAALAPAPAAGQGSNPFTIEARGGVAFPLGEFDPDAKAGMLIGATAKVSPIPFISAYLGWEYARFGVEPDAGFAGVDTSIEDAGVRVGGELGVPLAGLMSGIAPYFQLGATFSRARVDVADDESDTLGYRSKTTRGLELGGGARISLHRSFSVTPEVRYRRSVPEFELAPPSELIHDVTYLVTSVGVNFHF